MSSMTPDGEARQPTSTCSLVLPVATFQVFFIDVSQLLPSTICKNLSPAWEPFKPASVLRRPHANLMEPLASSPCLGEWRVSVVTVRSQTAGNGSQFSPGSVSPHDNEWMSQHLPLLARGNGPPGNEISPPTPNPNKTSWEDQLQKPQSYPTQSSVETRLLALPKPRNNTSSSGSGMKPTDTLRGYQV